MALLFLCWSKLLIYKKECGEVQNGRILLKDNYPLTKYRKYRSWIKHLEEYQTGIIDELFLGKF